MTGPATVRPSDVRDVPHDLYAGGRLLHVGVPAERVRINVGNAHARGHDLHQEPDGTVCLLGRRFVPQAAARFAVPPAATRYQRDQKTGDHE